MEYWNHASQRTDVAGTYKRPETGVAGVKPGAGSKIRISVRLFRIGVRFISRSEAKRVLQGLEKFREVVLDFSRVEDVGQGFADEVFRVWAREHPAVRITPVSMSPAVEFMVERARKTGGQT